MLSIRLCVCVRMCARSSSEFGKKVEQRMSNDMQGGGGIIGNAGKTTNAIERAPIDGNCNKVIHS